jgi:hypothetical protein
MLPGNISICPKINKGVANILQQIGTRTSSLTRVGLRLNHHMNVHVSVF